MEILVKRHKQRPSARSPLRMEPETDEIIVSFIKNSPKLLYRDKYNTQHYKSQIKT